MFKIMANNCLVTKLKGVVDNDSLEKFGYLRLNVFSTEIGSRILDLAPVSGKTLYIKATGGTFHVNGQSTELNEIQISSGTELVFSNNDFIVDISGKYGDIMALRQADKSISNNFYTCDIPMLVKGTQINYLIYSGVGDGELIFKTPSTVKQCVIPGGVEGHNLFVDINQFANASLSAFDASHTESVGSITSFGKCISGKLFIYLQNCSKLTGEINDLASSLIANGRTSGSVVIFGPLTGCTDDGNYITSEYLASKGGSDYVRLNFSNGSYTKQYFD